MESIVYAAASAAASSGIIAGIAAAIIAKEELKDGAKYFRIIQATIAALMLFLGMAFFSVNLFVNLVSIALLLAVIATFGIEQSYAIYPIMAVLAFLSRIEPSSFVILESMIFLYGLPTAALMKSRKEKIWKIIAAPTAFLIMSALLLFFL